MGLPVVARRGKGLGRDPRGLRGVGGMGQLVHLHWLPADCRAPGHGTCVVEPGPRLVGKGPRRILAGVGASF